MDDETLFKLATGSASRRNSNTILKHRSLSQRLVFLLYSSLTVVLTWPLIVSIATHVPGVPQWAFDESTFLWNIWYFKHSLIDTLSTPMHSDLIWYPLGIDLVLYTYNFTHALTAFPLAVAVNLPFGSNVALLLSTILSGYGTYLLVRYLIDRETGRQGDKENSPRLPISLSAFIAGLVYAFASNRAIYATLGHYDMVTTQWIPFYALMLLRALDNDLAPGRRRKAALLAGIFFALTGLAEMISALFLGIFTLIVLLVWVKKRLEIGDWRFVRNLQSPISNLFVIGIVAFLLWSPVLVPIVRQFLIEDFSLKGWGEAIPLSTDLLGWFTPTVLHPLFGGDLVAELSRIKLRAIDPNGTGFRDINTVFLGWVTVAVAVLAALALRRKVAIWIWTSLIFGIFTLGPFLQINGQYRFNLDGEESSFPLPYALLHYLPIIKANRAPNRNSVLLMLGLAVLVGYGLFLMMKRWGDRGMGRKAEREQEGNSPFQYGVFALLAVAILFEHLTLPAPLSDARIPDLYAQIADDPRPVSVMQLPLGWRNSFETFGAETTLLQYYQTAHGKPMIGGNISRAPDFKMDYFRRLPFFQVVTEIESGHPVAPELLAAANAQAPQLAQLYNLGYVIFYPPIPHRKPYEDNWQATWDFVKASLPLEAEPFWAEDGIEAFRVLPPPASDQWQLDLGQAGSFPYRGEGWDNIEADTIYDSSAIWATATNSRLFAPLNTIDGAASYNIALRARPFAAEGLPPQQATLRINDQAFETKPLIDDWQTVEWTIPGSVLQDGLNQFTLDWGRVSVPRAVLGGSRQIGTTGVELPIDAEVNAFADGAFISLFDESGEQIDASAGRAGVNVTVLDAKRGEIVAKQGFDTTANQFESAKLADFLAQIRVGQPVIIATKGEATAFLTDAAVEQLRTLGADFSLEQLQGTYFALIGVKGATPGSAKVEVGTEGAYLSLSLNRDRRSLAAAVDWVEIKPVEQ